MKYPLSNTLEAIRGHLPEQLISSECMDSLKTTAGYFPAAITSIFGFESRLWEKEAKVDFLFCVSSDRSQKDIFASKNRMHFIPAFEHVEPVWKNIKEFARWWADSEDSLSQTIDRVWLEFDMKDDIDAIPIPGIFWGLDSRITKLMTSEENKRKSLSAIERGYYILKGKPMSPGLRLTLFNTIEAMPGRCRVEQVGLMLSRKIDALRLVITKLKGVDSVKNYLHQVNWPGSIREFGQFLNTLMPLIKSIALNLDVGDEIYPRIGLECYVDFYPRGYNQRKRLIEYLVRERLCTPPKGNALLNWHGHFRTHLPHEFWESLVVKRFHHIKLDYHPEKPLRAKAYIGFACNRVGSTILKKVMKPVLNEGVGT